MAEDTLKKAKALISQATSVEQLNKLKEEVPEGSLEFKELEQKIAKIQGSEIKLDQSAKVDAESVRQRLAEPPPPKDIKLGKQQFSESTLYPKVAQGKTLDLPDSSPLENPLKLSEKDFEHAKAGQPLNEVSVPGTGQKISVQKIAGDLEEVAEEVGGEAKGAWQKFKANPSDESLGLLKKTMSGLKANKGKIGLAALAGGAVLYGLQDLYKEKKEEKPTSPTIPSELKEDTKVIQPKANNEFQPFQADLSKTKEQLELERTQEGLKKVTSDTDGKIKYLENGETKEMPRDDYIRQAYQDQKVAIANAIDLYKQESSENRKTQIFKSLVEGIAQLINGAYGFRNADRGVVVQDLKFDPMPWLDRSEEIKQNLNSNLAQAKNGVEIAERNKQLSDEELTQKIQSQKVLVDIAGRNADYANRVRDKQNELNQFNYLQEKRQRELESSNELKGLKALAKSDKNAGKLLQDITSAATEWDVLESQGDSEKAAKARAKLAGLLGDPNNEKFLKVREDIAKRNSSGIFTYVFGISEADQRKFTKPALLQMLNTEQESQPSSAGSSTKETVQNRWNQE
jgi:hypothetical protein